VEIEGHTDNVPVIPGMFEDNWDLSVSRAVSIVRILTKDNKVDPKRVFAAGHSEYMPVADNSTNEGKAKNRRTEIMLTPKLDELFKLLETK
jgi:chemotaxis protein MotB